MNPTIGIVYEKSVLNKVHKIFLIYFLLEVLLFSALKNDFEDFCIWIEVLGLISLLFSDQAWLDICAKLSVAVTNSKKTA